MNRFRFFFTLALVGGEWSASRLGERDPRTVLNDTDKENV
jgi:hypothetical protein